MRYPRLFFAYLALLSMLGFLATDMYLPAFTQMKLSLNTSASLISASLSLFLAGFCCAQLFWGPLSDRIGRKPVLVMGLGLFTLSCLGVLWVQDAKILLALRFLQATGVCAAAVCWQSLVLDYYPKAKAAKIFAAIMPLVALSPALAPLLGSWLIIHFDWRSIFLVLTLTSVLLIALTLLLLKQALPTQREQQQTVPFRKLLMNRIYAGNVAIYAACSASFFSWLTGSPFILADLGLSATDIGLSYIPQTVTFLIGGFGCRALLNHCNGKQLLPWLLALYTISVGVLALIGLLFTPTITYLLIPFSFMAMANGAIYPVVVARALSMFPDQSGKAAALQNFSQLGLCFIFSLWVSTRVTHALSTTLLAMVVTILLAILGFIWQYSRHNQSE